MLPVVTFLTVKREHTPNNVVSFVSVQKTYNSAKLPAVALKTGKAIFLTTTSKQMFNRKMVHLTKIGGTCF